MHLRFYTWLDRSGGVMPGENKQYPARPNAWYCIWTYLNLDILSTFLFWFRFKHRRGQFQVLVKMDRLINLWSIWALSAPSLDLRSFGPAILDYGWIMDGLWMDIWYMALQKWSKVYRVSHFDRYLCRVQVWRCGMSHRTAKFHKSGVVQVERDHKVSIYHIRSKRV